MAAKTFGTVDDLRADLEAGVAALTSGRIEDAQARFGEAAESARAIRGALRHPPTLVAGLFPGVRDDIRAAEALAEASEMTAQAGSQLAQAAQRAGWDGSGLPGVAGGGVFDIEVIEGLQPYIDAAAKSLAEAHRVVGGIDTSGLTDALRGAAQEADRRLTEQAEAARRASVAFGVLPEVLGAGGKRTYLVIGQTLADPRGSGGFPGHVGLLTLEDGTMSLSSYRETDNISAKRPVRAPQDVEVRYAGIGGTQLMISSTYSPDFPTAARMAADIWKASGRPAVDGVIATDSVWMAGMLASLGPVSTPTFPEGITSENASEVIDRRSFEFKPKKSDRVQLETGRALWQAIVSRSLPLGVIGALADSAERRHVQLWFRNPDLQAAFDRLDATGRYELPEQALAVVWQGISSSRIGYFAEKSVEHTVTLAEDGSAAVRTKLLLHNGAPRKSSKSVLFESGFRDDRRGTYTTAAAVYTPPGASYPEIGGESVSLVVQEEFGRPVAVPVLRVKAGRSSAADVSYQVPGAVTRDGTISTYRTQIVPQPALRPESVSVRIVLPAGARIVSRSPGLRIKDGAALWHGTPEVPVSLWVTYEGSHGAFPPPGTSIPVSPESSASPPS